MNFLFVFAWIVIVCASAADYWEERAKFLADEENEAIGASIILSEKEELVNDILMSLKWMEFDDGLMNPVDFLPSVHFFQAKSRIEKSEVFKFIQRLPKGSSLHSHDTALVSLDYLFSLTLKDDLYGCVVNSRLKLQFFPSNFTDATCEWLSLKEWRENDKTLDDFIRSQISIIVDDPVTEYPDINTVWSRFMAVFESTLTLVTYKPVFQEYFYQTLLELYEDNVMYLEFRGLLPEVYDFSGTKYGPEDVVQLYVETLEQFKANFPDFLGAKLIYAPPRNVANETMDGYVETALRLKELFPDFIAGFDLVGQEDLGRPLSDFIPQLLNLAGKIDFFFHAAETNWNGEATDLNLVDAILLNTTRIGHGYGVIKHPRVLKQVKERGIALEISPISNQVLRLETDHRNHPGNFLIASGYPVVICCDDPTFWGAKALSYDWYAAFMGMASRNADLRLLKQLALNSITYSSLNEEDKLAAIKLWEQKWDKFVDETLVKHKMERYLDPYFVEMT